MGKLRVLHGLVFTLALASHAAAAEFTVDVRNPSASDGNPGTRERPLKSISAAAAKVRAGDKVIIHRGEYRELVIIKASGTERAPILFEAAPGEPPVIKGSEIITGWTRDQGDVWKAPLPELGPRSDSQQDASHWKSNDVRQVFVRDGVFLDAQRLARVTARDQMKAGTFFCDKKESALYAWLEDSGAPSAHSIEAAVRSGWMCVYGNYVQIRGLQMRHASTTAFSNGPACPLAGEHVIMEDCVISWGDFVGVWLSGKSNRLSRCVVACNGAAGLGGTGENHLIQGCRFIFNNVDRYDTQWHAGGAKLIPNFSHSMIRQNEFARNLGPGLWLDGACDENVIDGNYAHDNTGPGIMIEISTGNLVMNNITVRNQNLRSGPYRDDTGTEQFKANSEQMIVPSRLFRPYHAGDGRGIYISSSPKTKVLHNTAFLNEAEGICVEGPPRGDGIRTVATGDYVVTNNISVFNHGSQLTVRPKKEGEANSGGVCDYNVFFSVGAVLAKAGWDGTSTFDLPQWQQASGQDNHSLDADPQFALAAMNDFRLLKSSPALEAAKPLPEVDHDYLGQPRGHDKTAMGACEAAAQIYPIPLRSRFNTEPQGAKMDD